MWPNNYWGRFWADHYWVAIGVPAASTLFRIFRRDCEVKVRGWGDGDSYQVMNPFGGESHEEPSGAEI